MGAPRSCWMASCIQLALISSVSAASLELHGPKFRILHVSDAHYHSAQEMCRDTTPSPFLCTHANTTAFLRSAIALEQPHMVAFTGDIMDEASGPRPREGMRDIYSTAIESGLPWAASLGNHEDVVPGMTRDVIYDYILGLPGRALSAHGPIATSPGNFYVDLSSAGKAVARLVFFDSRNDDRFVNGSTHSITDAQLDWFANLSATLRAVPTLAFYHIPLEEYQMAISAGAPISGRMREAICADKPNPRTFGVLKAGGVVGGFCGHDHTNDFCAEWQGVQLCYEGSPGFGAYGSCTGATCYQRRVRVTELALTPDRSALATIRSWKRLDGGGSVAGPAIDDELLWAGESLVWPDREPAFGGEEAGLRPFVASSITPRRMPVSAAEAAGLVRKKQPTARPAEERGPVVMLRLVAAAALLSVYAVLQHCRRQPAVDARRTLVEMKPGR